MPARDSRKSAACGIPSRCSLRTKPDVAEQEVVVHPPPLQSGLDHVHHRRAQRLGRDLAQQSLVDRRPQKGGALEVEARRLEEQSRVGSDAVHQRRRQLDVIGVVGVESLRKGLPQVLGEDCTRRAGVLAHVDELGGHLAELLVMVDEGEKRLVLQLAPGSGSRCAACRRMRRASTGSRSKRSSYSPRSSSSCFTRARFSWWLTSKKDNSWTRCRSIRASNCSASPDPMLSGSGIR